jgi:serine/threonine-protein kinase
LGRILVEAGAAEEGIRRLELGLALDADIPNARQDIGRTLALLGRWDEAEIELEKLRARDDAFTYWTLRARMALWRARPDLAEFFVAQLGNDVRAAKLAQVMIEIATGKMDANEAAAHFERLAQSGPQRGRRRAFFLQLAAEMNGFLGAAEPALDAMERAVEAGLIDRLWMERCPALAAARQHPRYARIHAALAQRTDEILAAYRAP